MNRRRAETAAIALGAALWAVAIVAGYQKVMAYSLTPGAPAQAPARWPATIRFQRNPQGPTVVMLLHPRCPCSRASLTELAESVARHPNVRVYLFFLQPRGVDAQWTQTLAWRMAERIPSAVRIIDDGGVEAARFGAHTSGQVVMYDAAGGLVFSGGITPARGHLGDNAGQRAVAALLRGEKTTRTDSPVFGCSLQEPERR